MEILCCACLQNLSIKTWKLHVLCIMHLYTHLSNSSCVLHIQEYTISNYNMQEYPRPRKIGASSQQDAES